MKSPCQTRREEWRKIEWSQMNPNNAIVKVTWLGESNDFKCAQCDTEFGDWEGPNIHIARANKSAEAPTPEKVEVDPNWIV